MKRSALSFLAAIGATIVFAVPAAPALAVPNSSNVIVEYTHVTFSVQVTVKDYPSSPEGDNLVGINCLVSRGGKFLGRGFAPIPFTTAAGKRSYSGKPITVEAFMSYGPAQTGDQYKCEIVGDYTSGIPLKKSWNPGASNLTANGTLP